MNFGSIVFPDWFITTSWQWFHISSYLYYWSCSSIAESGICFSVTLKVYFKRLGGRFWRITLRSLLIFELNSKTNTVPPFIAPSYPTFMRTHHRGGSCSVCCPRMNTNTNDHDTPPMLIGCNGVVLFGQNSFFCFPYSEPGRCRTANDFLSYSAHT